MALSTFDVSVLSALARFRFMPTSALVDTLSLGKSPTTVRAYLARRLPLLVEWGLVQRQQIIGREYQCYLTAEGATMMGAEGGRAIGIKLGEFQHDLALVRLCVSLETHNGKRLITERSIRSETPDPRSNPLALKVTRSNGRAGWSWPDLVSREGERTIAYEVEWTKKNRRRLLLLMHSYGYSHAFHYAVYFTNERTHDFVSQCAHEANRALAARGKGEPIAVRSLAQFIDVPQGLTQ